MNLLTAATCCCDTTPPPFNPCDPPSTGSAILLTWHVRKAFRSRRIVVHCGSCQPCTPSPCTPADMGNLEPQLDACTWSADAEPGGPACSYRNEDLQQNVSQQMAQPWQAAIPWASSGNSVGVRNWYTPNGLLTSFFAAGGQRVDTYQGTVAGMRVTYFADTPSAMGCREITTDPTCPRTVTVTFNNWPYYSAGPQVYGIRRGTSTSTARTWEVVGRVFRIKGSTGTVLWSTSLVGKTLAQLLTEANAQTAARVNMIWATTTTPSAYSQGLSAETYFADQAYTAVNIPTSTQPHSIIVLFTLTNQQPLPDPQAGQCSNAFQNIGWSSPIGGATLYDSINIPYQYGRGECSRALADEMCAGVGLRGQNNYYSALNVPCGEAVVFGALGQLGTCLGDTWSSTGTCCGAVYQYNGCNTFGGSTLCPDFAYLGATEEPVLSGNFRVGPLSQSQPFDCTGLVSDIVQSDEDVDYSPCCPPPNDVECSGFYLRAIGNIRAYVWAKIERIA